MQSVTLFQFHDGTIKSCKNSPSFRCFRNFNSTMVRLKGLCSFAHSVFIRFQFHDGTIKRNNQPLLFHIYWYFNSTMVRLKAQAKQELIDKINRDFNSTMVRLKE